MWHPWANGTATRSCGDSARQLQACKGLRDEVPSGDVLAGLARKTQQGRTVCGIPSCKLTVESSGRAEEAVIRYVYPIQQSKDASDVGRGAAASVFDAKESYMQADESTASRRASVHAAKAHVAAPATA